MVGMPFDLQPHLKSEFIELRPLTPEDWDDLFAVASDPLIWEQHPNNDRHEVEVFRGFFREAMESGGALIALDSKDARVIGSSSLARSHWGGVYNREMKQLMLRHAFRFLKNVVFLSGPRNLRSQRAVEKIGAVRVESRRDKTGKESFVFRLTAPGAR